MTDGAVDLPSVGLRPKVSDLLLDLMGRFSGDRISLGDILDVLGDRAYGLLMLILAAPNCVPIPGLPGMTTIFGLPLCFIAWQLFVGRPQPWLPRWLLRRSIRRQDFDRVMIKTIPYFQRIERLLKPRWPRLFGPRAERVFGGICFLMALLFSLPLPVGTLFPALAIALISLALLEQDGGMAVIGLGVAVVAFGVVAGVIGASLVATDAALEALGEGGAL